MKLLRKLQSFLHKAKRDAEMAEEMRLHVELQAESNIKAGMEPAEARYAALRQFGNVAVIQERAREQRGFVWLDQFAQDLKYGARLLLKHPGFTAAAVTVLALGIGANAAVFNLVHSLLFAPPTYARPAEVLRVLSQDRMNPRQVRDFSYPAYREIRADHALFSDTLASALLVVGVGGKDETRGTPAAVVSANFFSVLGVAPAQGRAFLPEEEVPGSTSPVVIVSHNFWRKRHFDPGLLGSPVLINGRSFTVIGIMPEGFTGTTALFYTQLWLPLGVYDQVTGHEGRSALADRAGTALMLLGRLKPGLTAAATSSGLRVLEASLERQFPAEQKDRQLALAPLSRFASNENDAAVAWVGVLLLGMAAIVLLVACLNLANMLLARGTARRKEIALRLALGGGRGRIVRQLLTEGLLLALLGGTGGLLLALWLSALLTASMGRMIPLDLVWTAEPQPALLAATFGFAVLGTVGFALAPALRLSRADALMHLKDQAGEDVAPRRWKYLPRQPLVSAQIALSLALLTAAALFMRSAVQAGASTMDTGLEAGGVYLVEVDAGLGGYNQSQAQAIYRRLNERFAALPGVESASPAIDVPLGGMDFERKVFRMAGPDTGNSTASAKWNGVGEDYFKAAGLPLLRGRSFTAAEVADAGSPPVVIINDLLAKQLWPAGDAIGQRLQLSGAEAGPTLAKGAGEAMEVVGIVPAVRHNLFESQPSPCFYLPFVRGFASHVFFHVRFSSRTPDSEAANIDLLRRVVHEVDPALPVLALKSFRQHLDGNIQIWTVRTGAMLFAVFGGLALCLAVVGIYGVVAYSVARRTREIGIRMALGARPVAVQRMILGEGAVMVGSGLMAGLLLALVIGKVVSSLLYRVGALDPVAFTLAPLVLALAAFFACWLPARAATKVDPMVALRTG